MIAKMTQTMERSPDLALASVGQSLTIFGRRKDRGLVG
jgi:hypothetical protein